MNYGKVKGPCSGGRRAKKIRPSINIISEGGENAPADREKERIIKTEAKGQHRYKRLRLRGEKTALARSPRGQRFSTKSPSMQKNLRQKTMCQKLGGGLHSNANNKPKGSKKARQVGETITEKTDLKGSQGGHQNMSHPKILVLGKGGGTGLGRQNAPTKDVKMNTPVSKGHDLKQGPQGETPNKIQRGGDKVD